MSKITIELNAKQYDKLQQLVDSRNIDINQYIKNLLLSHIANNFDNEHETVALTNQEVRSLCTKIFAKRDELYKRLS
ncbi:hypothetical protein HMPREF9444_00649 [Succinatimonas hippei YIT 12066]|uniref:Toxin-antitoxin system, antitoxin component, ribbon-helix-helix domain protein n=1 Tax=Succinatimonas hippei (strain DSM 22608 / JCM 16073 / KCTC 15190 / YIT 12066) TaxID=762983 RepID=E8LIX7_SUCHY|nr:hypothetical protein HMPREF9444_00649 [Succinatimonas hippei YIT 12066]